MLHSEKGMSQGNILMDFPTEYMRVFNLHSVACWVWSFVDDIPDSIMAEGVLNFTYNSPSLTIVNPVDDVVIKGVANSRYYNSLTFDGTNYIDTGMKLFDSTNNSKDFKVSFEITERNTTTKQSTIMSCMDESGSPWPGILYRILNGTQEEFQINVAAN